MAASPPIEHVVIDIDQELVTSLKTKVQAISLQNRRYRNKSPTIFEVPAIMRDSDPDAYKPKIISFGPYHSNNPVLKPMDHHKIRYLRKFLRQNPCVKLEDYLRLITELEPQARSCYSSARVDDISSNEFVEMMLLDGCFVVKLLFMRLGSDYNYNKDDEDEDDTEDPILYTWWTFPLIVYDMLMLENQIPFFVVEGLFNLATSHTRDGSYSLVRLILAFFANLIPIDNILVPPLEEIVPNFHHILHFFHSCIMPKSKIKRVDDEKNYNNSRPATPESVPCAMKLEEAGVKFCNIKAKIFLDVTFEKGVMSIPTLQVYPQTNSLFRNLIAFEQCFPDAGTHVSAYAVFMDCIIDTAEDVALLHRHGCIVSGLGNDNDVATLFNNLSREISFDYDACYLAGLFKDVNRWSPMTTRWNRWRAKLMRDYFSNPWSFLSLVGALVLIFLTVTQTAFAVISYLDPPKSV